MLLTVSERGPEMGDKIAAGCCLNEEKQLGLSDAEARSLLKARFAELEEAQAQTLEDRKPVELDQAALGRLSRMDAMQVQAMATARARSREQEKVRITAALNRIESGDFGYCLKCDEQIAEKRLRFDPSTAYCIDCAKGS